MLKLLDIDPYFFGEEPSITIIDLENSKGLLKSAADSRISAFASSIKPESDKIYVHILAMGAGEYYGANRNADYFPEDNLIKYNETFASSPAHIFKHHINKNPEIAIGKVIFSVYNDRMHRVEVIAWVDKNKGKDYVQRIESGEFPATSMACHTPFDTCSICGNQARSRAEYCVHLKNELGKILPNGKKVMAINNGPLKFFDMSFVFKPADITSSVLQKVAKVAMDQEPVLSSIENAELNELVEKTAAIKKLSELIKEVEGQVVNSSSSLDNILSKVKDPDEEVLNTLAHFDLHSIIAALAELGISPSVSFFAKLIGQKITGSPVNEISLLVEGLLKNEPEQLPVPMMTMQKEANEVERNMAIKVLVPYVKQASLFPMNVLERSFPDPTNQGYVNTRGFGYTSVDAGTEPLPQEFYQSVKMQKDPETSGLLKTLFTIGGAAIAAKWLLSKMIESKMNEYANNNKTQPVKIVLVKSAEEAMSTSKIVKASLLRDLTQNTLPK